MAALRAAETSAIQVLQTNCSGCHGAAAQMGGLDLRTREAVLKGGARGAAIVPGNATASLLFKAVRREGDLQMPPGKKSLSEADVSAIREWIDKGAAWTSSSAASAEPSWWSFRSVRRPEVPRNGKSHPVDAFVQAALDQKGLKAVALADKRTLIRRATIDLHGIPPTAEEIDTFAADTAPDAYSKLIDRLLDSPRYGERWGRHWLDVVRYADTGGFETDVYFPNAWRYRDYVIAAFNQDKPYNRFVQEQVAGDELFPGDLDLDGHFDVSNEKMQILNAKIATGLYTIGPAYHEAALFGGQVRYEWLTDVVDTTGEAFLGLTLGCARCNNHKFDPLTQRDYTAMMTIFAGSEEREIPVVSKFSIFGFKSGYPSWLRVEDLKGAIRRIDQGARKRVVDKVRARFSKEVVAAYDTPVDKRTPEQRTLATQLEAAMTEAGLQENAQGKEADIPLTPEESQERKRLILELGEAAFKANPVMQTATVLGHAETVPEVHIAHRGDWRSKGEKVGPAFPATLAEGAQPIVETAASKLQRRKALALWLSDAAHPLTARVMVNRVWHWHFGRGIVATPNDFGRQGEEPTHPELLDYLTSEFTGGQGGWSLKKLHRLIMTSETYRRSSAFDEANAKVDANNRFLWRMNRQRLNAEALRDSVLSASGALNLKMGGRPVIPKLSQEEYSTLWSRSQWPESLDTREHNRRSVYLYVKRTFPLPMLSTFDVPDNSVSCSRRENTTVAPQALTLLNGEFMVKQASQLASAVVGAAPDQRGQWIPALWRKTLGRNPSAGELSRANAAVTDTASLARLALVLLNTNEFLYVD